MNKYITEWPKIAPQIICYTCYGNIVEVIAKDEELKKMWNCMDCDGEPSDFHKTDGNYILDSTNS